jgi:thiamine biosynthesis lipoprotein ApbE
MIKVTVDMNVIVKGQVVDTKVLIINNKENEIMIVETDGGGFNITQTEDGEEVVVAYIKPFVLDKSNPKEEITRTKKMKSIID